MKSSSKKTNKPTSSGEKIIKSVMASFKIEGINISESVAEEALKKVNKKSLMKPKRKAEIEKRSALYQQGKLKTSTWNEVKKRTRLK